jgi:hypothetical protein
LFFAPDLASTVPGVYGILEEMELYHKQIDATGRIIDDADPADEHNHYLDAVRYMVYWLFGRTRMTSSLDGRQESQEIKVTSNIPALQDIARQYGLQFVDNRPVEEIQAEETDEAKGPIFSWT